MKWKFLLITIIFIVMGGVFLDLTIRYFHQSRVKKYSDRLMGIVEKSPTKTLLVNTLGSPWKEVDRNEAIELANSYTQKENNISKAKKYPKALIYLVGDIVYFIYLSNNDEVLDYIVVQN